MALIFNTTGILLKFGESLKSFNVGDNVSNLAVLLMDPEAVS